MKLKDNGMGIVPYPRQILNNLIEFQTELGELQHLHLVATQQCNYIACRMGVLSKKMEAAINQANDQALLPVGKPMLVFAAGKKAISSKGGVTGA